MAIIGGGPAGNTCATVAATLGAAVTLVERDVIGGAAIDTGFPLQLDSLHDLRLLLGPRSVIVKGRVVHSEIVDVDQDIVTYRTGIEFVEPSDRVVNAIAEYLDRVRTGRIGG